MNNTEQFAGLTLEQMLDAVTKKLEQAREDEKKEANVQLGELFSKMGGMEDEKNKILVKAAFDHVSAMKQEDIEKSDISRDYLGGQDGVMLTLSVQFPEPVEAAKLEDQLSEIRGQIGFVKNKAAMDLDQEASSAKELALVYLARRMRKDSPKWDEPKHAVSPLRISRGPLT